MHLLEKLSRDRKTRRGAYHRIDAALWAKRRAISFSEPLLDLRRRKDTQTVETPTNLTSFDLLPMAARVLVGAVVVAAFVIVNEWLTHFAERLRVSHGGPWTVIGRRALNRRWSLTACSPSVFHGVIVLHQRSKSPP